MKEKEGIYVNYFELDDCEELSEEICPFHKRLSEIDLDIIRVHVYYDWKESKHNEEEMSFKEFQDRILNDKKFLLIYYISLEAEDYGIEQIAGEVWVRSFDKKKSDLIYNMIK